MEQPTQSPVSSRTEYLKFLTTLDNVNLNSSADTEDDWYGKEEKMAKTVILSTFPVILVIGTIGNLLTFIVMQRGSLKHLSTCFYMAMLAVADTCKYFLIVGITEYLLTKFTHFKKSANIRKNIMRYIFYVSLIKLVLTRTD